MAAGDIARSVWVNPMRFGRSPGGLVFPSVFLTVSGWKTRVVPAVKGCLQRVRSPRSGVLVAALRMQRGQGKKRLRHRFGQVLQSGLSCLSLEIAQTETKSLKTGFSLAHLREGRAGVVKAAAK